MCVSTRDEVDELILSKVKNLLLMLEDLLNTFPVSPYLLKLNNDFYIFLYPCLIQLYPSFIRTIKIR